MSNVVRMTLTNDSITFTRDGVYVQPVNSEPFRFGGSPSDLISIMVYHTDLDIDHARFRVREYDARMLQMVHGNLCHKCNEFHTGNCLETEVN